MEVESTGQAPQAPAENVTVDTQAAPSAPQTTDIDSFSAFKFQGQEYTPQALAQVLREHGEYGQKVEQFGKYHDAAQNLKIDLDTIARRPDLAWQFKEKYPQEMHFLLEKILKTDSPSAPQENTQTQLPKEYSDKLRSLEQKVGAFERAQQTAEVAAQEAYLQKTVDPLFEKYPYAKPKEVQNAVFAQARALIQEGYRMTDAAWERLVKDTHLAIKGAADNLRQAEIKTQQEASLQGADVGRGGTPPGQAPPKAPTSGKAAWDWAEKESLRQIKALG